MRRPSLSLYPPNRPSPRQVCRPGTAIYRCVTYLTGHFRRRLSAAGLAPDVGNARALGAGMPPSSPRPSGLSGPGVLRPAFPIAVP